MFDARIDPNINYMNEFYHQEIHLMMIVRHLLIWKTNLKLPKKIQMPLNSLNNEVNGPISGGNWKN